ncbi:hypothetical protein [Burkholderia pseudomultivorans]|uniref:Prevent-host-death protein n=1 Tax=Burkholderia cenocepacia TaxID=95486 RepID=A0AAN0RSY1_9BURK|nr:hypothetical protein [Burkholderia pseudomultivorans]AIO33176.1 hypothetical protein DM39_3041 [Burkholderia cenocepacia]KVG61376.1 hypothetical protein WS80_28240 [Burkholderia pseudomultivorans]
MQDTNPPKIRTDSLQRADASLSSQQASAEWSASAASPVRFGVLRGQFRIPDDFDAPLPDDLLDAFEGR